ncbi:ATP-binding cassette domain-containing protein, partial [Candidatus Proelusimicrobium excrementi]|uniref:ATP-binding cassette domain-containing protein n=1 Tax=Candidatus Proelusimicrobium excrementi TaxID=3416222 RepID=UPI003D0BA2C4
MIKIKDLKKYFGSKHILRGVNLDIKDGEVTTIIGGSGTGKSTLIKCIIRLLEPDGGEILVNGKDITHVTGKELRAAREKLQIVFQDPYSSLNPRLRIESTIMEPLKQSGRFKNKEEMKAEANRLMELVGIDKRMMHAYPHELDGGRRQRIGIARALSLGPKMIVC